jgi:hypothetical protein
LFFSRPSLCACHRWLAARCAVSCHSLSLPPLPFALELPLPPSHPLPWMRRSDA